MEVEHNGTGTQWDWDTMGLGHNGTGTQWDWDTMGLNTVGLGGNETQGDWYIMSAARSNYFTHTHTRTHARTHARTHTYTHTHTHARTHARTHAHTHTHTSARFLQYIYRHFCPPNMYVNDVRGSLIL